MSRKQAARIDGIVSNVLAGGMYSVQLRNGRSVQAKLSERLARFRIRILQGDKVSVGVSDGVIMSREKLGARECAARYR